MKDPKEYAKELVEKFTDIENKYNEYTDFKQAKQCALIAVDEMLNFTINNCCEHQNRKYFEQVKQEIYNIK